MSPRSRERLLLAAVLVLTAAVYGPTFKFEFTNWDDPAYISKNSAVQKPSLSALGDVLDPRTRVASEWTPLVTLTHMLEQSLLGGGPAPAHAGNVLLHLVCVSLVFSMLRSYGASPAVASLGSLLFALHPLQVENVAWASGRKTLLAASLSLGAFLLIARGSPAPMRLWSGVGLYLLALGSKGTAVVLPLWVLASCLLVDRGRLRRLGPWLAAMFVFALARGLLTIQSQEIATRVAGEMGLISRLEIAGPVLLTYLGQLVWPADLCAYYDWEPRAAGLLAWVGLAGLGGGLAHLGRADPRIWLFGALSFTALLPTMNLLPGPYFQADRYLYAALVGGAYLVPTLVLRIPRLPSRIGVGVLLGGLGLLAAASYSRSQVWSDSRTLWNDTLECAPNFAAGWSNLGLAEMSEGRREEALSAFRRAREVNPDYLSAYANEGELLARIGRRTEAEQILRAALNRGDQADVLNNLAWLILDDRPARAESLARRAVELQPNHAAALDTLGVARLRLGNAAGARDVLERSIRLRPDVPDLHYHLAQVLAELGEPGPARAHARRALSFPGGARAPWAPDAERLAR